MSTGRVIISAETAHRRKAIAAELKANEGIILAYQNKNAALVEEDKALVLKDLPPNIAAMKKHDDKAREIQAKRK